MRSSYLHVVTIACSVSWVRHFNELQRTTKSMLRRPECDWMVRHETKVRLETETRVVNESNQVPSHS